MTLIEPYEQISAPWVWEAADLAGREDWIFPLSAATLDDIDRALSDVKQREIAIDNITASDFPLPSFNKDIDLIRNSLERGPGMGLVRGVPVDKYDHDGLRLILWGIGTHIGLGAPQSFRGDMIGDVMDMSHTGDIQAQLPLAPPSLLTCGSHRYRWSALHATGKGGWLEPAH